MTRCPAPTGIATLSLAEGTLLWSMRTWVAGLSRPGVDVLPRIAAAFADLRAPDAASFLDGFMWSLRHGAVRTGHIDAGANKKVGLLIAVLALCLALVETGAKSNQTIALAQTVTVNDLWAFFQARSIRETVVTTAAEQADLVRAGTTDPAGRAAVEAQQKTWRDRAARWADDPAGGEGRKQLADKARDGEQQREEAMARYHLYEYSAAAFQVAIVVISASIVVTFSLLRIGGVAVALVGAVLGVLGLVAPHLVHLG